MKIEDGNKLIAEFMGYKLIKHKNITRLHWEKQLNDDDSSTEVLCAEGELKYFSSWNWLMPVVEKIETINNTGVEIRHCSCHIYDMDELMSNEYKYSNEAYFDSKIEAVWQAAVKFIQWHNKK